MSRIVVVGHQRCNPNVVVANNYDMSSKCWEEIVSTGILDDTSSAWVTKIEVTVSFVTDGSYWSQHRVVESNVTKDDMVMWGLQRDIIREKKRKQEHREAYNDATIKLANLEYELDGMKKIPKVDNDDTTTTATIQK